MDLKKRVVRPVYGLKIHAEYDLNKWANLLIFLALPILKIRANQNFLLENPAACNFALSRNSCLLSSSLFFSSQEWMNEAFPLLFGRNPR